MLNCKNESNLYFIQEQKLNRNIEVENKRTSQRNRQKTVTREQKIRTSM